MKRLITLLFLFSALMVKAQYSTPGTGVSWDLDSLVTHSGGTVILNGDHYEITSTLTLQLGDTLSILDDVTVIFHDLAGIESTGVLTIDAPTQAIFTAIDTTSMNKWRGFKLIVDHVTHIRNATFSFGGGIRAQTGTFSVEGSTFYKNYYKSGSTAGSYSSSAALDLSGYASVIDCRFISNQRGAIGSGSNVGTSAIIRNNYMFGNVTENSNRPQINMGPAGENDTTFIVGNTVIGNGFTSSGGIAYSSLLGVPGNVVIDSNTVNLNRYGIALTGSSINGAIRYNTVTDNNIQNLPNLGGSGLNFTASGTSSIMTATVTGNVISGNLWGITIVGYPSINMGDSAVATFNPGGNQFWNNGNGGVLYDLYNNGPVNQKAMFNCWGVSAQDSVSIDSVIVHKADVTTLGLVSFMPSCAFPTQFTALDISGTPISGVEINVAGTTQPLLTGSNGQVSGMVSAGNHTFTANHDGFAVYNGDFAVEPGDNSVVFTMLLPVYQLAFYVFDENSNPVANASIAIQTETLLTGDNGLASINLENGQYEYTVSKEGYYSVTGNATIQDGNSEVSVQLISTTVQLYTLSFGVQTPDGTPLENVSIAIEGQTLPLITNDLGIAVIELPNGLYNYTASLANYYPVTESIEISGSAATVGIVMYPDTTTVYDVTFIVSADLGNVEGAEVQIDGQTIYTNQDGIATIALHNGTFPYSATAIDFSTETGVVTVNGAAVEVLIFLETGTDNLLSQQIAVYPNPAAEWIFIKGLKINSAEIWSMGGSLLKRIDQVTDAIYVGDLNTGSYLIKLYLGDKVVVKRVMKK